MRLVVLAAVAAFAVTGAASAAHHHHHHSGAPAAAAAATAPGAAPVDTLSAHDARMKNLHDSGYDPAGDLTPAGTVKQN
jgi:hypothetical protein